ncbi:hypothetical protein NDU88_004905 [Pleurodeles waltl]|uniref:Uncharacterized protein n=1 Tax=Pleurodeles waltl TaxID=8319 RepID=A0AAV7TTA3_PLEWA|nr:hypothetical protein NDU88_004905 [Pleurodeles waltl]
MPINEHPGEVSLMCEMEEEMFSIDGELALGQKEWVDAMVGDEEYDELKKFISRSDQERGDLHESLKQYLEVKDELSIQGEKVLRREKVVPPEKLRMRLIRIVHT